MGKLVRMGDGSRGGNVRRCACDAGVGLFRDGFVCELRLGEWVVRFVGAIVHPLLLPLNLGRRWSGDCTGLNGFDSVLMFLGQSVRVGV